MIDFSAIEGEIEALLGEAGDFASTNTAYIREVVPVTQMPSLDISAGGHQDGGSHSHSRYSIPVLCVIRRKGVDRKDNATRFKEFVEGICAVLEGGITGESFDVIRNIESRVGDSVAGDGSLIRVAEIRFNCLAH